MKIPSEMISDYFKVQEVEPNCVREWDNPKYYHLFQYDLAYFLKLEGYKPWHNSEVHIPLLIERWNGVQMECRNIFKQRKNKEAIELIREGIAIFLSALFWSNGKPVHLNDWQNYVDTFPYKPVNVNERLQFILESLTLYPSFIQLGELFTEFNKQYAISVMKNRLSSLN